MSKGDSSRVTWASAVLFAALPVWAGFVLYSYLPEGLPGLVPALRELIAIPLPTVWKAWWLDPVAAAALAFCALCVGGHLRLPSRGAERLLLAFTCGWAGLMIAAAALALAGWFRPAGLRTLTAGFVLAALPGVKRELREVGGAARRGFRQLRSEPEAIPAALLASLFLVIGVVTAAAPETSFDALVVHLHFAQSWLERGTFALADVYRSNSPLYIQTLYALGWSWHGESLARFLNFLFLPAAGLAVFLGARLLDGRERVTAGLLAAALLVSAPVALHHATVCYPDLGSAFFGFLAVYAVARMLRGGDQRWLALAGIFAGMSAGTKFAGLYGAAIAGAVLAARAVFGAGRREAIRDLATFAVIAVAIAGPWYVRNWYFTGDPLHPSLHRWVRQPVIDSVDAANLMRDALNLHRLPASLGNLAALPWWITMEGHRFTGTIGPVFLSALPLVVAVAARRRDKLWCAACGVAWAWSLLWFGGPQWMRYFLPPLMVILCLTSAALATARWLPAAAVALALVNLPPLHHAWLGGGRHVLSRIPWAVSLGSQEVERYRQEQVGTWDALRYLNVMPGESGRRILAVPAFELFPPAWTRHRVLDVFDAGHILCRDASGRDTACYTIPPDLLRQRLERERVAFLAIRRSPEWAANRNALRLEDPLLRSDFEFLDYVNSVFLYRRRAPEDPVHAAFVNVDFAYRWVTGAGAEAAQPGAVRVLQQQPVGSESRLALAVRPDNEIRFAAALGQRPRLSFAVGFHRGDLPRQGTRLTVRAEDSYAAQEMVFDRIFYPDDAARGWQTFGVSLRKLSGTAATITWQVRAARDGSRDWMAIADPVIYAEDVTRQPPPLEPFPFLLSSKARPRRVGFQPAQVHVGETYVLEVDGFGGSVIDLLYATGENRPQIAARFCLLDGLGRARIPVPAGTRPGVVRVLGVRRAGERLWEAADGVIEVLARPASRP